MNKSARARTQLFIRNGFLKLLNEIPFSDITIDQICEKAMIHRSTFYRHFIDKYELMEDISTIIVNDLYKRIKESSESNKTIFEELIEFADENRNLILNVTTRNESQDLLDKIRKIGREFLYVNSKVMNDPLSQLIRHSPHPDLVCDFYSCGFGEILTRWINNEYSYSKEEFINSINNIMSK